MSNITSEPDADVSSQADGIRINRYISSSGFCSRRKADELVASGSVTIDQDKAIAGSRVSPGQVVRVDGVPLFPDEDYVYIALHKPLGITCTSDTRDKDNVIDFLHFDKRIYPIGRLDKMSTGLLLLTNDGSIVNKILRAEGRHEKEYMVQVDKPVTPEFLAGMQKGVPILDTITLPCKIMQTGSHTFKMILTQGLNRQIRRMCEYFGYEVCRLKRTRILNIDLGTLPQGEWRNLTFKETRDLLALVSQPARGQRQTSRDNSDF
jgi:23S rRNA pseudouridine2604 synthase